MMVRGFGVLVKVWYRGKRGRLAYWVVAPLVLVMTPVLGLLVSRLRVWELGPVTVIVNPVGGV